MSVEVKGYTKLNFSFKYREVTTSSELSIQDDIVEVSGSGVTTQTLPDVTQVPAGKQFIIKNSSSNTVTVEGSGSQQIDHADNVSLTTLDASVSIAAAGTKWIIV